MRNPAAVLMWFMRILYFDRIRSPIVIFSVFPFEISTFSSAVSSISLIWSNFSSFFARGIDGLSREFSIF
jgi:hypothetical protein